MKKLRERERRERSQLGRELGEEAKVELTSSTKRKSSSAAFPRRYEHVS